MQEEKEYSQRTRLGYTAHEALDYMPSEDREAVKNFIALSLSSNHPVKDAAIRLTCSNVSGYLAAKMKLQDLYNTFAR